ncbi:MAG: hypothetical protein K2X48_06150 [Chitinophagaceae bacterium]|nr:hypothetical protein [Chitinophagaceae bacterium]
MDTKLMDHYGEHILSYRLRTARQKKRMQYEDFDKQLIALYKKERALLIQKRNLGWEPLTPPVQKGWKRFFVLREDVAKCKQADFFETILKKINTYDWSWRKDFKVKRRRFGKKIYVLKPQKLLECSEWQFKKLAFTDVERQMFDAVLHVSNYGRSEIKYVFREPWRFVLKIAPNMIDKIRKKDGELESRIQGITNFLERNDFRKRQIKIMHGSYGNWVWNDVEKYNEQHPFKNKSISQVLDLIKNN